MLFSQGQQEQQQLFNQLSVYFVNKILKNKSEKVSTKYYIIT